MDAECDTRCHKKRVAVHGNSIPLRTREFITSAAGAGCSTKDIADSVGPRTLITPDGTTLTTPGVSLSSVQRYVRRAKDAESIHSEFERRRNFGVTSVSATHREIAERVEYDYLATSKQLASEFGVSGRTVSRTLGRLGYSYKNIRWRPGDYDPDERKRFEDDILAKYPAEFFINFDEAHVSRQDADNVKVWSRVGHPIEVERTRRSYEDGLTLLAAVTYDGGVVQSQCIRGSVDTEDASAFLFEVIDKHLQPYPGPNSILLLDNWGGHDANALQTAATLKEGLVVFLPAYSPHYAPVEMVWHRTKEILRSETVGRGDNLEERATRAISSVTVETVQGYYRHCKFTSASHG